MADILESRDYAVRDGVSNRSRGWMPRRPGDATDSSASRTRRHPNIKRWDGKSKTSMTWNSLERDPELWLRHGNCFVHLYACGQSRQGPSFKVPISTLLASRCHPLVERFIAQKIPAVPDASVSHTQNTTEQSTHVPPPLAALDYWSRAHLIGRVDLYIPPPANADHDQAFGYYLAIRNLFAWVFQRPVVGKDLGHTLSNLYDVMCEFRHPQADNVQDLLCYLEDEGYTRMADYPVHALAMLQLSETIRYRALYINAFSHCVGMYNDLYLGSEYAHINSATRKFIRWTRLEMDLRLGSAGSMLSNLLEEQLSEAHLSLPRMARVHLDKFRAHIQSHYTSKFGQYPPASIDTRSTIFEPKVYRVLADDFEALYEYLVDGSFTTNATRPTLAQGGLCVLQSVRTFDQRHGFTSLKCPLPRLPELPSQLGTDEIPRSASVTPRPPSSSMNRDTIKRRLSWLSGTKLDRLVLTRAEKLKLDSRLIANTALLKASNKVRTDLWNNGFVAAYRQFEEDAVLGLYSPDGMEKASLIDTRKVCWILVYAVHQTLHHCLLPSPAEVNGVAAVKYHLSISPKHLPTWEDKCESSSFSLTGSTGDASPLSAWTARPFRTSRNKNNSRNSRHEEIAPPDRCLSMTAVPDATVLQSLIDGSRDGPESNRALSPVFDIRPDIDYLGLANRDSNTMAPLDGEEVILSRSRSLSQTTNFRRSLILFRGSQLVNSADSGESRPAKYQMDGHVGDTGSGESNMLPIARMMPSTGTTISQRNSFPQHSSSPSNSDKPRSKLQRSTTTSRVRRSLPYHEIIVHGYGNGTNPVQLAVLTHPAALAARATDEKPLDDTVATPSTTRSLSTSSTKSNTSARTADTALTEPAASIERTGNGTHYDYATHAASVAATDEVMPEKDTTLGISPTIGRLTNSSSSSHSMVTAKATHPLPLISPRGCEQQSQPAPSIWQKSRVCTRAPTAEDPYQGLSAESCATVTSSAPVPPPIPRRSSARQRRFSVYGGGDEYAAATPVQPMATSQRSQSMKLDPQRRMPLRSRTQPVLAENDRDSAMLDHHLSIKHGALQGVYKSMGQRVGPGLTTSSPSSRTSWCFDVAALRSVHEEEGDLTAPGASSASASAAWSRSSSVLASPSRHWHRHSSYVSSMKDQDQGSDKDFNDRTDENIAHRTGEVPEWEKYAMGLGGHTIV
ncbi:hypothetical protein SEPCBS57363_001870 [Sporothrix epigloea]|uniref:DUF8004 domain-containing protein n=1 Tax=Sporothrix epigloea TaxID=1892477 RepID=A0ABP0DFA3_9PEZI